jgi:short-subunit dehydrogenase
VNERALIVGAGSGMGRALARELASRHCDLILAGRQQAELERNAKDLAVRFGVEAVVRCFEATDFESHPAFFAECVSVFPEGLDGVLVCHGEMPEQADAEADFAVARQMLDVNYSSAVSLLELAARYLEERGSGWICALSSVAGERGRASNYLYGASKSALSTYLSGLRARLAKAGVRAVDVRPGFIDTSLTYGRPGMFLVGSPERAARDTVRAIRRGRGVVHTPWFWGPIMWIIRSIPEPVFKRLPL